MHYLIYVLGMINLLGPWSARGVLALNQLIDILKNWQKKQNFINLPLSSAKLHLLECWIWGYRRVPKLPPAFCYWQEVRGPSCCWCREALLFAAKCKEFRLPPGDQWEKVYKATWLVLESTRYCKSATLAVGVNGDSPLPVFGQLEKIWVVNEFVYFKVFLWQTDSLHCAHQAYHVKRVVPDASRFVMMVC